MRFYEEVRNPTPAANSTDVIDRIWARRSRSVQASTDMPEGHCRIGLVVEGGTMRGIVSGGALMGLEALGLGHCFDAVYGSSAGAINSAYLLAGQAAFGGTIYYEDLTSGRFIDFRRFPRVVDLDFLMHDVIVRRKPLDLNALVSTKTRFKVYATDADSGEAREFSVNDVASPAQVLSLLHASAAVPLYYNKPIEIDGRRYLDANVSNPVPIHNAIRDGCTHVLVCLTRPVGYRSKENKLVRAIERPLLRKLPEEYRSAYLERHTLYNRALDAIFERAGVPDTVKIFTICPSADDLVPSRTTTNSRILKRVAAEAMVRTFDAFNVAYRSVVQLLTVNYTPTDTGFS